MLSYKGVNTNLWVMQEKPQKILLVRQFFHLTLLEEIFEALPKYLSWLDVLLNKYYCVVEEGKIWVYFHFAYNPMQK